MSEERARQLAELSRILAETGVDHGSVLKALTQHVSALLGDGCLVELIDADGQALVPVALHHPEPEAIELARGLAREARSTVGTGVTGVVAQSGRPAFFPSVEPATLRGLLAPTVRAYLDRFPVSGGISVPLRTREGIIGAMSVWRDRTPAPYMTEDVDFLQSLADHAALAIANARLYRRLSQAYAALEARTEHLEAALSELESFSYAVSHDLQVPLRGIRGLLDLFLDEHGAEVSDAGHALLARVTASADRMRGIILALLDLSRVSSLSLVREPVDISALAEEVAAELTTAFPGHPMRLQIEPDLSAECDRRLMRIALQNLLSNGWKFTEGRPDAELQVLGHRAECSDVIEVRDNGVGFDMAHVRRLFQPFQRLHMSYPGTGVGLATVARIVRRHGGRVSVTAAPGQGATFRLELPRLPRLPPDEVPIV